MLGNHVPLAVLLYVLLVSIDGAVLRGTTHSLSREAPVGQVCKDLEVAEKELANATKGVEDAQTEWDRLLGLMRSLQIVVEDLTFKGGLHTEFARGNAEQKKKELAKLKSKVDDAVTVFEAKWMLMKHLQAKVKELSAKVTTNSTESPASVCGQARGIPAQNSTNHSVTSVSWFPSPAPPPPPPKIRETHMARTSPKAKGNYTGIVADWFPSSTKRTPLKERGNYSGIVADWFPSPAKQMARKKTASVPLSSVPTQVREDIKPASAEHGNDPMRGPVATGSARNNSNHDIRIAKMTSAASAAERMMEKAHDTVRSVPAAYERDAGNAHLRGPSAKQNLTKHVMVAKAIAPTSLVLPPQFICRALECAKIKLAEETAAMVNSHDGWNTLYTLMKSLQVKVQGLMGSNGAIGEAGAAIDVTNDITKNQAAPAVQAKQELEEVTSKVHDSHEAFERQWSQMKELEAWVEDLSKKISSMGAAPDACAYVSDNQVDPCGSPTTQNVNILPPSPAPSNVEKRRSAPVGSDAVQQPAKAGAVSSNAAVTKCCEECAKRHAAKTPAEELADQQHKATQGPVPVPLPAPAPAPMPAPHAAAQASPAPAPQAAPQAAPLAAPQAAPQMAPQPAPQPAPPLAAPTVAPPDMSSINRYLEQLEADMAKKRNGTMAKSANVSAPVETSMEIFIPSAYASPHKSSGPSITPAPKMFTGSSHSCGGCSQILGVAYQSCVSQHGNPCKRLSNGDVKDGLCCLLRTKHNACLKCAQDGCPAAGSCTVINKQYYKEYEILPQISIE